jgi:hypothetical protein
MICGAGSKHVVKITLLLKITLFPAGRKTRPRDSTRRSYSSTRYAIDLKIKEWLIAKCARLCSGLSQYLHFLCSHWWTLVRSWVRLPSRVAPLCVWQHTQAKGRVTGTKAKDGYQANWKYEGRKHFCGELEGRRAKSISVANWKYERAKSTSAVHRGKYCSHCSRAPRRAECFWLRRIPRCFEAVALWVADDGCITAARTVRASTTRALTLLAVNTSIDLNIVWFTADLRENSQYAWRLEYHGTRVLCSPSFGADCGDPQKYFRPVGAWWCCTSCSRAGVGSTGGAAGDSRRQEQGGRRPEGNCVNSEGEQPVLPACEEAACSRRRRQSCRVVLSLVRAPRCFWGSFFL